LKDRKRKIPNIKENIVLVVEGKSDYQFIEKLKKLFVNKFNIDVEVAESGTRILKKYKSLKKQNPERRVIVLYDLDNKYFIKDIKRDYSKEDIRLKDEDLYFVNPKIEFLFILWYRKRAYTIVSDEEYQQLIFKVFGIQNYRKTDAQLKVIMREITEDRAITILKHLEDLNLNRDSSQLPSTNFQDLCRLLFEVEN